VYTVKVVLFLLILESCIKYTSLYFFIKFVDKHDFYFVISIIHKKILLIKQEFSKMIIKKLYKTK